MGEDELDKMAANLRLAAEGFSGSAAEGFPGCAADRFPGSKDEGMTDDRFPCSKAEGLTADGCPGSKAEGSTADGFPGSKAECSATRSLKPPALPHAVTTGYWSALSPLSRRIALPLAPPKAPKAVIVIDDDEMAPDENVANAANRRKIPPY